MINNTTCTAEVQNCYVDTGMPFLPYRITDQPRYAPYPWYHYTIKYETHEQPKTGEDSEDNHLADLANMIHDLVRLEIEDLKKGLVREVIAELGKEIKKQGQIAPRS